MADSMDRKKLETLADTKVADILQAAASWAREVPPALTPAIRAVCVRLAEMVADQRHYLAPLPEPQESERAAILTLTGVDELHARTEARYSGGQRRATDEPVAEE